MSVQVHGHEGADPASGRPIDQAALTRMAMLIDERLDRDGGQVECLRVYVAEHRPRAGARNRARRREERERRGDDFIARADPERHQRQ
jgi:hypothetical protein